MQLLDDRGSRSAVLSDEDIDFVAVKRVAPPGVHRHDFVAVGLRHENGNVLDEVVANFLDMLEESAEGRQILISFHQGADQLRNFAEARLSLRTSSRCSRSHCGT